MKLRELEAYLIKIVDETTFKRLERVESLEEADGVLFLCPACFVTNNGPVGTHSVICWFNNRGVSPERDPKPGRWNATGTGLDDLTFVGPGAFSVRLVGGCNWHGYIENGEANTR